MFKLIEVAHYNPPDISRIISDFYLTKGKIIIERDADKVHCVIFLSLCDHER